jgi:hypothetical protein
VVKVKKEKVKKAAHPLIGSKTGYPFASPPTDFDFTKHKPLGKKNFTSDGTGFNEFRSLSMKYKGNRLLASAKRIDDEIATEKTFGTAEQRKSVKKALKLKEQLAALEAELLASGIPADRVNAIGATAGLPGPTATK